MTTPLQKLETRAGEIRIRLSQIAGEELTDDTRAELDRLRNENRDVEVRMAALRESGDPAADLEVETRQTVAETEDRRLRELRDRVQLGEYVNAAAAGVGVTGAAWELNQALGMRQDQFPLELMVRDDVETRAARDGDAMAMQGTWLDRVFAMSAAERVGISFRNVMPGVATYPATTAGGVGAQRARTQAAAESTYTIGVTELKPKRNEVYGIYSREDELRLPGLSDALVRDMQGAIMDAVDKACFLGDTGATGTDADITGLTTATGVVESTITQSDKVKGPETLEVFTDLVDGIYAVQPSDLRVVSAVGANSLWASTVFNSAASNETIAQFLRANGVNWTVRGDIESNTANNDYAAFVGLGRGLDGAGIAAVWDAGELIRDPYGGRARQGEVGLTLAYYWDLALVRPANYKRVKFVT